MLTLVRRCLGLLVVVKAVAIVVRAPVLAQPSELWLVVAAGVLMAVGGAALALHRVPRAAAAVVAVTAGACVGPLGVYNHHLYLVAVVATILALDVRPEVLLRAQLTIVYAFGALTKVNDGFLSGTELHVSAVEAWAWRTLVGVDVPAGVLVAVSVLVVAVEAFLAVAFWSRRTRGVALVLGLGLHAGMLVLMSDHVPQLVNLLVYGTLMWTLYLPFFADRADAWLAGRTTPVHSPEDAVPV